MNNSKKTTNKKIGIFRALDVRVPHAEFATSFKNITPFFGANLHTEIRRYLQEKKINYADLQLQPKYIFDPVFRILKKTDFTPWLEFDQRTLQSVATNLDIVEVYEPYFFYASQIADLARKKNIPLITEIWTSFPEHPSKYIPPYSLITANVIRKTNLFVLRSQKAQSFLESFHIPGNKKVVIYHGVNIKRFYPEKKKKHERIRILFVGALAEHKGLDDLLDVFHELVEKFPNKLELAICGDGPLRERVIRLTETLPIHFLGSVSNFVLPEVYRSADIYCQPSKDYYWFGIKGGEEFAGYTFMEALASGLPIVSTYCGGVPEIVGDDNSLITQGNKQQLFHSLATYITSQSLRDETGVKNRKRAEDSFDLLRQTAQLEEVIKEKLS